MKFFKGTLIILCLLFFLNVSLVSASFETTVNLIEDNEGTFNKITGDDLTLSYQFNTGEKIEKDIKSSQPLTIDFNHELFCFEDCNVIPKRIIYRTEIRKNYDLISGIDGKNADFSKNSLINVYLTEKINSKYEGLKNFQTPQEAVLNENDKFVSWNGVIVIDEEANYSFYLNITGKAKVSINNETVFDNINSDSLENNTFNSLLENGNYTLSLEYWSNIDSKPNLFYATTENKDYKVIPEDKLKFINGFVKEYQSNKGMRAFSASSFPESYPIDYSTYPTAVMGYYSLNSQRTPLLLIHGLHGSDSIDTGDTSTWNYWNNIPSELIDYNYDVWELYYIPANVSNFMTSGLLKNEINEVLSHYSVSKLDVVSHSMGGFVTLGYIEGLGKSSSGASVPYDNNIRKYIIIASPLHGAFSANRVLMDIAPASYGCNWLANLLGISPDDEYAQAYLDLAVGSEFTWLLNKNALNSQINYLVITGNQGIPCVPDETKESNSGDSGAGNDGLVAVSSASLLDKNIPLVILGNYNHANEKGNDYTGFFTVNVQKEVDIIDDFIKGNGVQAIKSNLGSGDYYIDPQDSSSNTFNRGTTVLKINSNQNVKEVKIKNKNSGVYYNLTKFKDVRHNSETNNWFYFSDNNLSMYYPTQDYNNQKYGLTFPKGNYEIYVNGEKISTEVEIKGAQTTMKEIDLTPPSSCTTPTNGMSISQNTILCSGNYSLPNGIVITSNNVILDCNGAKIIGSGSSNGITTKYNGASGITIKNCNINSFDKGIIILSQNSYMTIENNNLQSNNYGVYIDAYATYNSIIKNQFNNNVHDIEIGYESNHNTISQNLLNGSTFSPIRISEADFITIQDNNIYPKSNGIYIGRSNYNTLTNNQIVIQLPTVNSDGIWFFSSEENNILNNYVKGWKGGGIRGDFLNKSLIANNTVDSNKYYGLELSDSNNNRVVTNNLIKNGWYGLSLSGSSNNLIYSNKFDLTGINQNVEGNDFCFEGVCNICINGATGINCSCSPNWVLSESWGMCNISDYQSKEWIDTNGCNDNSNKPPAELLSCDFCNYTLAYTNWSNWKNQTECSNNVIIQNRSRALYDSNYPNCFAVTQNPTDFWNNKTEWEFNNLTCTSICNPNLINTSWSNWQNLSCIKNDKMNQSRYLIQYDSNNCGIIQNKTIYEYNQNLLCDFCRPNMINTTISDWKNQTTCLLGDYYIQNKSKTEYDSNFSSCYLITNLSSDLWNNGMNKTYWEFRNQTCDFCVLNLVNTSWSEWSNLGICTIKDIQNQSRFSVQYDSKQCSDHNIQNQTIIDYKTTSCDYCNYSVKTISTEWQNDSCLITDIMKQKRTNVTYDSNYSSCYSITHLQNDLWNNGQNITIQEFKELGQNSCNYCSEDISQPQFTQWSQCSNGIKNRVKYYIDSNYASCCAITNVDSDCSIKGSIYQNVTETSTDGCTTPPNVTANSLLLVNPVEGIYSERSIMFNLSSQDKFTKLIYTDNGGRESSLCTNCNKYTQKKSLSDGNHVLLFRGILPNGKNVTNQTELFVDSKDPQISTIKPQSRRYTNGSDFYIKYTEDNCRLLNLTVKRNQSIIVNSGNCSNGRNVEKFISQDISSFDGQEVEYQFIITDVAGNRDESRLTRIRVDTTAPQIIQFTNWTIGNYEYFNMTINELNFNKVEYYDNTESRPSWRSMCTSLKNGNCYKKVYFRDGNHNLNIRITDDAGNAVFRNVAFTAI